MKTLTIDELKVLPFSLTMHLNAGKQHSRTETNEEYGLYVITVSEKPNYRIVKKILVAKILPDGYECDLLLRGPAKTSALAEFIEFYNAAVKAEAETTSKGDDHVSQPETR